MLIGILQLDLKIGDAMNLRDKRRILNSIKDRWRHHQNVSVAEVDQQDHPQHAVLGIAMVGNEASFLDSSLSKLVEQLKQERYAELLDYRIEIISGR